ncbi:DUF4407 domain-containing protein (plasmid) [Azospirillum argentinense]|uniref:DUF4407 domain-containing protein n=2 Tax=Azospirillum argentinense TaxID=2970906 RepID=A0A4D8PXH5_9PROT|nr:DUF4407 domain-containing protein [Azospirillum argentinense]
MVITLALLTVVLTFFRLLFTSMGLKSRFKRHDSLKGISFPYAVQGSIVMRAILFLSGTRYEIFLMSPTGDRVRRFQLSISLLLAFIYMCFSYYSFLSVSIQGELFKSGKLVSEFPYLIAALFIALVMLIIDMSIIVGSNHEGVQNSKPGEGVSGKAAMLRVAFALVMGYFASSTMVVYVFRAEAVAAALYDDKRLKNLDTDVKEFKSTLDAGTTALNEATARIKTLEDEADCLTKSLEVERTGFLGGKRVVKGQVICGAYTATGKPGTGPKFNAMQNERNGLRNRISEEKSSLDTIQGGIIATQEMINPSIQRKNNYIHSMSSNFMMLHNALIQRAWNDPFGVGSYFFFMTLLFMVIELAPLILKFYVKTRDYDDLCKINETNFREFFEAKIHLSVPREDPQADEKVSLPEMIERFVRRLADLIGEAGELLQKILGMVKRIF